MICKDILFQSSSWQLTRRQDIILWKREQYWFWSIEENLQSEKEYHKGFISPRKDYALSVNIWMLEILLLNSTPLIHVQRLLFHLPPSSWTASLCSLSVNNVHIVSKSQRAGENMPYLHKSRHICIAAPHNVAAEKEKQNPECYLHLRGGACPSSFGNRLNDKTSGAKWLEKNSERMTVKILLWYA